jgi:O-methyltransferase
MNQEKLQLLRNSIIHLNDDYSFDLEKLLVSNRLISLTEDLFFEIIEKIIFSISKYNISGDFVEVGVWKGATAIYIKALMEMYKIKSTLWLFDAFDTPIDWKKYTKEKDIKALNEFFNIKDIIFPSLNEIVFQFNKFELNTNNIELIEGDVFDTLESQDIKNISLLRLDIDMYESTLFALEVLYPLVCSGGYIIIDDYYVEKFNCKEAVDYFRSEHNILEKLNRIGNFIVYWQKK